MYHQKEVVMFLSFGKNKEPKWMPVKIEKKLKGPLFHFQKCVDQKYL